MTRVAYCVPFVRPLIVCVVIAPPETTCSRPSVAASANVSVPDFHCTLYPVAPLTAVQDRTNSSSPSVTESPVTLPGRTTMSSSTMVTTSGSPGRFKSTWMPPSLDNRSVKVSSSSSSVSSWIVTSCVSVAT